jgi:hypothetical protein
MAEQLDNILQVQSDIASAITRSRVCRDLIVGVQAIKAATTVYLPMFAGEKARGELDNNKEYNDRLQGSTLKNYFKRAVQFALGQIGKKDVTLLNINNYKSVDSEFFTTFLTDVDKKGNNLNIFGKQVIQSAIINPAAFVIIDAPKFEKTSDGKIKIGDQEAPATLATEKEFGLRPYFVNIPFENVITCFIEFDQTAGIRVKEFSFTENFSMNDKGQTLCDYVKFTESEITREKVVDDKRQGDANTSPNNWNFVPLSILILGERETEYMGVPPLIDLADNNISHFQKTSTHNSLMNWVRNPTWFGKKLPTGKDDTRPTNIGVSMLISATDDNSDLKNVGIDAAAVSHSISDLQELENWCESYTLSLLASGTIKTATQADGIMTATNSAIKDWAQKTKDFFDDLFFNLCLTKGIPTDKIAPDIFINQEFNKPFDTEVANFLQVAANAGRISKRTFLTIMQSMGIFGDDFDIEAELKSLAEENPPLITPPIEDDKTDPQDAENRLKNKGV